ncbi:site-specific integrase [Nonomuraea sp. NPDC003754]
MTLLLGARTKELCALTWSHVNFDSTPPSIVVWRSVREGGDIKTKKSRRTLAMPMRCVDALKLHRERQEVAKKAAGESWQDNDLVFASKVGTELGSHNVRRSFRAVLKKAGLNSKDWTPREMRHSFVLLLSDSDMPIEAISRLVGHRNTSVTETVYLKQLRPVLLETPKPWTVSSSPTLDLFRSSEYSDYS